MANTIHMHMHWEILLISNGRQVTGLHVADKGSEDSHQHTRNLFYSTVCSLGEVRKFLLISWAWKVSGSSGAWQTFNDTWTFDKYILHCTTNHFLNYFFIWLQFHQKFEIFEKDTQNLLKSCVKYRFCSHF
jgi:hypothetical protein